MPIFTTLGAACAKAWGFTSGLITDQYFNLVSLLLPGNGTNGAQNNTFLDGSSNNFTITRNGNTTQGTFSPFSQTGWGNYFSGGAYLSIGTTTAFSFSTGDFTIEGWIFPTSDNICMFDARAGNTATPWVLNVGTGTSTYFYDGTSYTSSIGITLNQWNHVAVSRSSGTLKIFVNGQQGYSNAYTANLDRTAGIRIGNNVLANQSWTGYLSNIRIVKGQALYTSAFTPSTTPLTTTSQGATAGNVSLLSCQSNRFIDNSSNNFTVTANNGPSVVAFSFFAPTAAYTTAAVGGSGYFDGNLDYLNTPSSASLGVSNGNFTLEFWVYQLGTRISLYPIILSSSTSFTANNWSVQVDRTDSAGKVTFFAYNVNSAAAVLTSNATLAQNSFYHIAFVRNGATLSLYINGTLDNTANVSTTALDSGTTAYYIGSQNQANTYFYGYISGLRLLVGSASAPSSIPTSPPTAITNTQLLLNFTNAGITDATAKNDLETVGNAQISTTQSKWGGGSISFDGTGDFLQLPASNIYAFGTGDYTVETWVRFTSITTTLQIIFESGSTGGNSFYFHVDVDQISVGTSAAFVSNQATTFTTDQWYHIAACRSNGTLRLYKDGAQVGSSVTDSTNWTSSGSARIGANFVSGQTLFGYLDDFRISRFARYTGSTYTVPTAPFPVQ